VRLHRARLALREKLSYYFRPAQLASAGKEYGLRAM